MTFRIIPNDASRVAALLAGDVDFVDFVPPSDVERLGHDPRFAVHDGPSSRMMILLLNFRKAPGAGITDAAGQPMEQNPLLDQRVRLAISKAIDRRGLVDKIMAGEAYPASQIAIQGMDGYDPNLPVEPVDPAGARALLAAAGFPNGFGLNIDCSNNRYPNDDKVCQAVGQMLARAGFHPKVETMPFSLLLPKLKGTVAKGDVAIGMLGLGAQGVSPWRFL